MNKPVLVVMAAGIGARYGGGIKQLAKVGPSGELVIDYSVYDAREAGFETVIFIIRKDIEEGFRQAIGDRISEGMDVIYAYQDLKDLPRGFTCPKERKKPWGTGHAVLSCRNIIEGPFAVINADDYYGKEAFRLMYDYLSQDAPDDGIHHMAMAGFVLGNTLSDNGSVTRGVCFVNEEGKLIGIEETKSIERLSDGKIIGKYNGQTKELDANGLVSMNFWGFRENFINRLGRGFIDFLDNIPEGDLTAEYLLPIMVDGMLKNGEAEVDVLPTNDQWFGMTYAEDREIVAEKFQQMVDAGIYPSPLVWSSCTEQECN